MCDKNVTVSMEANGVIVPSINGCVLSQQKQRITAMSTHFLRFLRQGTPNFTTAPSFPHSISNFISIHYRRISRVDKRAIQVYSKPIFSLAVKNVIIYPIRECFNHTSRGRTAIIQKSFFEITINSTKIIR